VPCGVTNPASLVAIAVTTTGLEAPIDPAAPLARGIVYKERMR
jgi:hypothetical protein